jgi:Amiloride-sensitive sodium channel
MIPMDEMFFECKYKDKVINCKDHLKEIGLSKGLCYIFNGVEMYRRMKQDHMVKDWTIDEGYAPIASMDAYPYRASGSGAKFGLSLLMGYKKKSLKPLCERKSGFWVQLQI